MPGQRHRTVVLLLGSAEVEAGAAALENILVVVLRGEPCHDVVEVIVQATRVAGGRLG